MPIVCVKSVKIYTSQKKFTRTPSARPWQIWGMSNIRAKRSEARVRAHSMRAKRQLKSAQPCLLSTDPLLPSSVYMGASARKNYSSSIALFPIIPGLITTCISNTCMLISQFDFSHYSEFNTKIAFNGYLTQCNGVRPLFAFYHCIWAYESFQTNDEWLCDWQRQMTAG